MNIRVFEKISYRDLKLKCLDSWLYDFTNIFECKMTSTIIPKILKNTAREGQNRRRSRSGGVLDASCNNVGFEAASWRHLGLILAASWRHLGAILRSRIEEMSTKTDVENETIFGIDFSSILKGFEPRDGSQIRRNSKKIRCEKMIAKVIQV